MTRNEFNVFLLLRNTFKGFPPSVLLIRTRTCIVSAINRRLNGLTFGKHKNSAAKDAFQVSSLIDTTVSWLCTIKRGRMANKRLHWRIHYSVNHCHPTGFSSRFANLKTDPIWKIINIRFAHKKAKEPTFSQDYPHIGFSPHFPTTTHCDWLPSLGQLFRARHHPRTGIQSVGRRIYCHRSSLRAFKYRFLFILGGWVNKFVGLINWILRELQLHWHSRVAGASEWMEVANEQAKIKMGMFVQRRGGGGDLRMRQRLGVEFRFRLPWAVWMIQ